MIRLSDLQWERIRHHFPEENIADGRPGRWPVSTRQVLKGTLWILNTGAQWHMLPQCYPNYKTVHRRFQTWCRSEVLRGILMDIANELRERGVLDEEECFIDATFVMAKGGGAEVGAGLFFLDIADVSKMSTPMLAEIFLLRVETATREAARDKARFVPIMLPAAPAKPASVPSVRSA